jgi:hypothetical protein
LFLEVTAQGAMAFPVLFFVENVFIADLAQFQEVDMFTPKQMPANI